MKAKEKTILKSENSPNENKEELENFIEKKKIQNQAFEKIIKNLESLNKNIKNAKN